MRVLTRICILIGSLIIIAQANAADLPTIKELQKNSLSHVVIPNQKEKTTVYYYAADETREPCKDYGFLCTVQDGSQQWIQGTYSLVVVKNGKAVFSLEVGGQNYRHSNQGEEMGENAGRISLLRLSETPDSLIVVPSIGAGGLNFYQRFYRLKADGTMTESKLFLSDGTPWESFANFSGKQNKDGSITSWEPFYRADEKTIANLPGKLDEHGFLTLNFTYRDGNFYADLPKK